MIRCDFSSKGRVSGRVSSASSKSRVSRGVVGEVVVVSMLEVRRERIGWAILRGWDFGGCFHAVGG